jgi:hypothetical protein
MADRQLKLPFSARPVTRVVPARLVAAQRPMLATGNKEAAGGAVARPPVLVVGVISGAPTHQGKST